MPPIGAVKVAACVCMCVCRSKECVLDGEGGGRGDVRRVLDHPPQLPCVEQGLVGTGVDSEMSNCEALELKPMAHCVLRAPCSQSIEPLREQIGASLAAQAHPILQVQLHK